MNRANRPQEKNNALSAAFKPVNTAIFKKY